MRMLVLLAPTIWWFLAGIAGAGDAGFAHLAATHGDRPLSLTIWYPAASGGKPARVGANAVFAGAEGLRDAVPAEGPFPLVMISHGGMRSAPDSGAWVGAMLAAGGNLAVEVNGPPPEGPQAALAEFWQRPGDISAGLDAVLDAPDWGALVDRRRIMALGFYLGGTSALSLAGGILDAGAFAHVCDGDTGPDCAWFAARGVDPAATDPAQVTQKLGDARFAGALAVSPEYARLFKADSLGAAKASVEVLWLGEEEPLATESQRVEGATRFDGFSTCKPKGPAILEEEGGDPAICGVPGDGTRDGVHMALCALIAQFIATLPAPD